MRDGNCALEIKVLSMGSLDLLAYDATSVTTNGEVCNYIRIVFVIVFILSARLQRRVVPRCSSTNGSEKNRIC